MSEGAIGLSVLLSISVLSALVFHWRIAHFKLASFGAAFFRRSRFKSRRIYEPGILIRSRLSVAWWVALLPWLSPHLLAYLSR